MIKQYFIIFIFLLTLFGARSQQSVEYMQHDGTQRSYIQYLPTNFNASIESLPLVVVLHGLDGSAQQMTTAGFNSIADTARFIPIYPQGKLNGFGQTSWANGTMLESNVDDIDFIDSLITKITQQYNINTQKVYVCGLSAGGIMTYRLALELNEQITAVASMAGTISTSDKDDFFGAGLSIPVMHWHGTVDQTVPFYAPQVNSVELVYPTMDFWKNQNSCSLYDSTIIAIPDTVQDNITVDRIIYEDCMNDSPLELWKFNNGYHTWYNKSENDVDGAIEFWNFFKQFESSESNLSVKKEQAYLKLFPNPGHGTIKVRSSSPIHQILIYQSDGRIIKKINTSARQNLSFSLKKAGLYFVKIQTKSGDFHKRLLIE